MLSNSELIEAILRDDVERTQQTLSSISAEKELFFLDIFPVYILVNPTEAGNKIFNLCLQWYNDNNKTIPITFPSFQYEEFKFEHTSEQTGCEQLLEFIETDKNEFLEILGKPREDWVALVTNDCRDLLTFLADSKFPLSTLEKMLDSLDDGTNADTIQWEELEEVLSQSNFPTLKETFEYQTKFVELLLTHNNLINSAYIKQLFLNNLNSGYDWKLTQKSLQTFVSFNEGTISENDRKLKCWTLPSTVLYFLFLAPQPSIMYLNEPERFSLLNELSQDNKKGFKETFTRLGYEIEPNGLVQKKNNAVPVLPSEKGLFGLGKRNQPESRDDDEEQNAKFPKYDTTISHITP